MAFGKALREARIRAGLTQKQLADAVGVKQPSIGDAETGKKKTLGADTVFAIEKHLKLKVGQLACLLPKDHVAHLRLEMKAAYALAKMNSWSQAGTERKPEELLVPDYGIVYGSRLPPDVPEPERGKKYQLTGRFPANSFVLKVDGHSVQGYGVFDGDVIAVRPTEQAEEGALMVLRQGNAYTLKGYQGGKLFSFGRDEDGPVEMDDSEEYRVVGVMLSVVDGERRFLPRSGTRPARRRK